MVQDLLVSNGEKDHNNLNFIYMIALLYFGFLFVFFGLIVAALYLIKSSPSKKKEITKKKVEVEEEDTDTDSEKESVIYKGFSLIPDSIFGISIYVLIILFCIWIFSDFGGECGVDYAPRFFGEC